MPRPKSWRGPAPTYRVRPEDRGRGRAPLPADDGAADLPHLAQVLGDLRAERTNERKATDMSVLGFDLPADDGHGDRVIALAARMRGTADRLRGGPAVYARSSLSTLQQLSGQGLSDFPHLLGDAAEQIAVERFRRSTPAFRALTREVSFTDFKASTVARPPDLRLADLGDHGQLTAGVIDDSGETAIKISKAVLYRLSRASVVNDSVGHLREIATGAADAANDVRDEALFKMLLGPSGNGVTLADGVAMFATSRGNLLTAGALSETTLGAALAALRGMTSDAGSKLNLGGRHLVVPAADELTARQLARDTASPGATPINVIATAHISTGFYVFADPEERTAIALGNIGRSPFLFESDSDFRTGGARFRLLTWFGIAPVDPRGVVKVPA